MIEKKYTYSSGETKIIEKILEDAHAAVNHMILPQNERLPLHHANSNVYMVVIRGRVSLSLDEQEAHSYDTGSILVIPYGTKMDVRNAHEDTLELFVLKAPAPATLTKE